MTTRMTALLMMLLVEAAVALAEESTTQTQPVAIGHRRQFWFNTQDLIAQANLIHILQQRPVKSSANPVLVADRPWEGTLVQAYSCDVHYNPETSQWQIWYEGHPAEVLLCTAFSNDGIHWTKPALGIEEWNGSRENNIILQTGYWDANCASIVKAPTETDPARRYKLYYWVGAELFFRENLQVQRMGGALKVKEQYRQKNGHYVAFSSDGVHFTPYAEGPAIVANGDYNTTLFDEHIGKYRSYSTYWTKALPDWEAPRRCIAMTVSDDGVNFPQVKTTDLVLIPDATDDEQTRARGGLRTEYYGMHVWPQEDFYLGLLWLFRLSTTDSPHGRGWDDGRIEPYLIFSANGREWNRLPVREPFIPHGSAGSFEAGSIYSTGDRPVALGDELRFYYFGVSYTHGHTEPKDSPKDRSGVGFATLARDRYVAWQGGTVPGTLRTKPLNFEGQELHLNLDASRGETRIALLDADGNPLPGFGVADCTPICSDSMDHVVQWANGRDLSALSGQAVQVQFSLRHSALYTWQFK